MKSKSNAPTALKESLSERHPTHSPTTSFETSQFFEAYRERCEDRIDVIIDGDRTLIVIADGAGGTGDGHSAAETVIRETRENYTIVHTVTDWSKFLSQLDFRVNTGESTAVIIDVRPDCILGASVGDSCAWGIDGPDLTDLTHAQIRKPLLDLKHETQNAEKSGSRRHR